MNNLVWSPTFVRAFKRLVKKNPELRSQIEQILQQIAEDPYQLSLRSHKLKGDSSGRYSCSIDYRNRILFKFVTNPESREEEILLLTLGSHDDVY
ncbi:type II toxin-antitoxin system YoeB family toxin [uncultured Nostoc sp.]|uniref:type II toxin-antitoxin system RelE/ParE family toxin n=1 Tax=uncultured Nostoc sp. TaxID=340711 RepID=UPI00260CD0EE|nr:type II toxin-antitoxin system YoeB family toxin [uncultured Nostoc sp.]